MLPRLMRVNTVEKVRIYGRDVRDVGSMMIIKTGPTKIPGAVSTHMPMPRKNASTGPSAILEAERLNQLS